MILHSNPPYSGFSLVGEASSEKMGCDQPPTHHPPSKIQKKGKFCKNQLFLGNFALYGQKRPPPHLKITNENPDMTSNIKLLIRVEKEQLIKRCCDNYQIIISYKATPREKNWFWTIWSEPPEL